MVEKCPNCGNTIKPGNKFCKNCGYKIVNNQKTQNDSANQQAPNTPMPAQPMPYNPPTKHSGPGTASLVLGIISMCLIWVSFFWFLYIFIELPMGIIATILGAYAYWGKAKDKFGMAGFILGLIVLILGAVFAIIPLLGRAF